MRVPGFLWTSVPLWATAVSADGHDIARLMDFREVLYASRRRRRARVLGQCGYVRVRHAEVTVISGRRRRTRP